MCREYRGLAPPCHHSEGNPRYFLCLLSDFRSLTLRTLQLYGLVTRHRIPVYNSKRGFGGHTKSALRYTNPADFRSSENKSSQNVQARFLFLCSPPLPA